MHLYAGLAALVLGRIDLEVNLIALSSYMAIYRAIHASICGADKGENHRMETAPYRTTQILYDDYKFHEDRSHNNWKSAQAR